MTSSVVRTSDELSTERLQAFTESIRGEWVGYEADFDSENGQVKVVPDYYIPEDFTTWSLQPKGFECNHSTIVRGTKYYRKFMRVLPAVAVFADHVDLETTFDVIDIANSPGTHCFHDGSYSGGPSPVKIMHKSLLDKWPLADLCLRDRQGKRGVHAKLTFDFENVQLVSDIRVVVEAYSCIYCDGADIEGSSGYVEGWSVEARSKPEDLSGTWSCDDGTNVSRPDGGPPALPRRCLYLPSDISVGVDAFDGGVRAWVGWVTAPNERRVLSRYYDSEGQATQSKLVTETRI